MPRPSCPGTDGEQCASAWGAGVAAAVASAAPAEAAAASTFHELLGQLCGEHERLQREAAALAEENRTLRSRVPQRGGGGGGNGADEALSAGPRSHVPQQDGGGSADGADEALSVGHVANEALSTGLRSCVPQQDGGGSGDGADEALPAGHGADEALPAGHGANEALSAGPRSRMQQQDGGSSEDGADKVLSAGREVNPAPTDEPETDSRPLPSHGHTSSTPSQTSEGGVMQWRSCKLDEHRLSACIRRIQAAFRLEDSRTGICLHEVLGLLRESPGYEADSDALVGELFEWLGAAAPRSRPASRRPSFLSRNPSSLSRSMSFASKKHSTNDAVDTREVKLTKFAELMLAREPSDLIRDSRPEHMKVLRIIKRHVFHQDSMGVIPTDILQLNTIGPVTKSDLLYRYLDMAMNAAIVANAITVGWFAGTHTVGWGPPQTADLVFTLIFTAEMLIKLWRSGLHHHFLGPEWAWNVFDASIVCLGLVDFVTTVAVVSSNAFNPSSLLALRLIRLGRLLRVARLALFRELKLMVNGIFGLLKTLSCALVILLLIVYFLGICLVQVLGFQDPDAGEVVVEQAMLFESVPRSMFTVFRCLMTGDCTLANGTPLALHLSEVLGWPYTIAYSLCCVLVNYGIGSLITALVVDTTLNEAKKAEYRKALKDAHQRTLAMRLHFLGLLFEQEQLKEDDQEHRASYSPSMLFLSRQAFVNACKRQDIKEVLDLLDIDEADRRDLFDALDADGNGYLEMDELVEGLTKMGGKARKADTVAARLKLGAVVRRLEQTHAETQEAHRRILERLEELHSFGSGSLAGGPVELCAASEACASGAKVAPRASLHRGAATESPSHAGAGAGGTPC